ncbi:hypothetical protein HAX54_013811 [Datura stramonium]|uniref:SAP domain-containing protein n=1 Tax=Datura stramonium TaxID=4076 RepID=A0ABS8RYK1_DATST|nr:hypothetical protein [Datura stramonium]
MGAPDLRSRLMMVEGSLRRKRNLMLSGRLLRDQVPLWYVLKGSILWPRVAKVNDQSQPQWEMMSRRGLLTSGNKRSLIASLSSKVNLVLPTKRLCADLLLLRQFSGRPAAMLPFIRWTIPHLS